MAQTLASKRVSPSLNGEHRSAGGIILPPKDEILPPPPATLRKFTYRGQVIDFDKEHCVMDGSVAFVSVDMPNPPLASGIVLTSGPLSKVDKLIYGIVIGCGKYISRLGHYIPEIEKFPLPNGTLVEMKPQHPYVDWEHNYAVNSDEVTKAWLPGKWPCCPK